MTSSRPYLVRAMYQWIADNGMTPHLLVDVAIDGVQVPEEHVQNGKIILNIAPMAVTGLVLGDDEVTFLMPGWKISRMVLSCQDMYKM